ncbi:MAG: hypothetical protein ABEJ26_13835 [Halosimplex sp.]
MDAETGRRLDREAYDLSTDPAERTDVSNERDVSRLSERLDAFLDEDGIRDGIREHPRDDVSAAVENRLDALGYK